MLSWSQRSRYCWLTRRIKYFSGILVVVSLVACSGDTSHSSADKKEITTTSDASQVSEAPQLTDLEIKSQLQGSSGSDDQHPGAAIYVESCATCHDSGVARAPARNIMELMSPNSMHRTLTEGIMRQQAATLSDLQKNQVVEYLVGTVQPEQAELKYCEGPSLDFDWSQHPTASGWGIDTKNSRHISSDVTNIDASNVSQLEIKWVFDYPQAARARSQPSIAGGAIHVGSQSGALYALDQASGCVRWSYQAGAEVRTGITIKDWDESKVDKRAVGFFADVLANVYAIDLSSGELIWKIKADDHPNATLTAQPVYFEGRIYQAVSSLEVVPAADPEYACCSFRGSIAILDSDTGKPINKIYTIPQAPTEAGKNNVGTQILAPSGAPVWNSPTLDKERRQIYFGTGENYSSPADGHSDAIIAVDIDKQEIAWVQQTTSRDAWNVACMEFITNKTNCPVENGPDVDFGAPPILIRDQDHDILVAGQKSGEVFGISPQDGKLLWRTKVGRGGVQGGMHFGMAADGGVVYVPISDYTDTTVSLADAKPGMYAVDANSGKLLWSHPAVDNCGDKVDCDPGISAAVTSIEGAVIAGHMDGMLRAYAKSTGKVLWETDTDIEFTSIAGRVARGGSFGGGSGPIAHKNMLYANSGYGLYFHRPGNVLIAWGLPE